MKEEVFCPKGRGKQRLSPVGAVFFLCVWLLAGCASVDTHPETGQNSHAVVLKNVPFYAQEDYQCGPASLAAVLNYRGVPVAPEDIARDIYSRSARGTLSMDMVLYAERKGLGVSQYSGGMDDLRYKIDSGNPLIVLVDNGFSLYQVNHFMVVIGYAEGGVIVNSGRREGKFISAEDFLSSWKRTKFWTLWVKSGNDIP